MAIHKTSQAQQADISIEEEYAAPASLQRSGRRLAASVVRLGGSLAALPLALLPGDSRRYMRSAGSNLQMAGREVTLGVASLLRAAADNIEEMAQELSESEPRSYPPAG
ncbi:MAG: hypothetical protein ACRDHL_06500 [Candidatus Promineifilaceae bacterium]